MKIVQKVTTVYFILILLACKGNPEKDIINHWKPTKVSEANGGRGGLASGQAELEFKENGTVNIYTEGNLMLSTTYALASDGKSLIINEPSGRAMPMSIKVLKLNSNHLDLALSPEGGRSDDVDTVSFEPKD